MVKKIITIWIIVFMQLFSGAIVNATNYEYNSDKYMSQKLMECPINIAVHEAWDLLNSTGNGIQIPIDVRFKNEWNEGFIDTPWPEHPRWYSLSLLKTEDGLQAFMDMYAGEEVILYCKSGSRSLQGSQILCDAGFTGTIYNMQGGISTWIAEGYPIRINTEPLQPDIIGPSEGEPGEELIFNFSTEDIDEDRVYYWVDWNDTTIADWIGPFVIEEVVTLTHIWDEKGIYQIKAKTKDIFNEESDLTIFEITIFENQPPEAPTITGPFNGKPRIEYEYTFNAVDPNGDDVKYLIDWGDNTTEWTDLNGSGTDVTLIHAWTEEGAYLITGKAEDESGLIGPESTLIVTIPRNKPSNFNYNIFMRFLEHFPLLERLLNFL